MLGAMRRLLLLFCVALAAGCDDDPPAPPPPPPPDTGPPRDTGPLPDTGPRPDAGPRRPTVDGLVSDREWRGAAEAESEEPTDRSGSELRRLRATIHDDQLFFAIEGSIAEGDSLVLFVDRAMGVDEGVADLERLDDERTALAAALSREAIATPADFAADFGWATTLFPHAAVGLDDAQGWRDLTEDPTDLVPIDSETAPSICGAEACEGAIPLETLGGAAPRRIGLFARILRADTGLVNQTLPMDDPDAPDVVTQVLTVVDGEPPMDGGVDMDAGLDAGPRGVVVDGVLSAGEWDAASRYADTGPAPFGSFAGNDLRTLYALRTADRLYVAIEGDLTAGNAFVMYVDREVGGAEGATSPTPFADFSGDLDRALSKTLFPPAEFRIDVAWGTLDLRRAGTATDARMGWREVGTNPSVFVPIGGAGAPTVCSANVCETSIALTDLGTPAGGDIGLFVRLVAATSDGVSNQTLPTDDPSAPELISLWAVLPP